MLLINKSSFVINDWIFNEPSSQATFLSSYTTAINSHDTLSIKDNNNTVTHLFVFTNLSKVPQTSALVKQVA